MINDKVFVYVDDEGHCHVFPCENREDLINIYEAAANSIIEYLEDKKKLFEKESPVTQEDVDACPSERAKQILKGELRQQQRRVTREDEEIKLIKGHISDIKKGGEAEEEDFIENMAGHGINFRYGEFGCTTIQKPNFNA